MTGLLFGSLLIGLIATTFGSFDPNSTESFKAFNTNCKLLDKPILMEKTVTHKIEKIGICDDGNPVFRWTTISKESW